VLGLSGWVSFAAVVIAALLAALLGRRESGNTVAEPARSVPDALNHPWAPAAVGALTAAVVWFAWGGLARAAVIHDEAAYVLQAELFARGAWIGRAPVIPEFFEQLYVLVTPVLASKYPPGHSLMLVPGALIGLPGLPVVLLNGVTGALIFALARRITSAPVGLLAWLLWITCFPAIYFRASYLSEVTSSAAWLVAWWSLLRWRETRRLTWLIGVAGAVGLVAVTRPLTAVALAVPIAVVVLRDTAVRRSWRHLGLAVGVGAIWIALIPLWSARTTGSPWLTPLALYTRAYVPFDVPGFGLDTTVPPVRSVPRDMAITNEAFRQEHRSHTVAALPRTLVKRLRMIVRDMWYDWRLGLAPFALLALTALPVAAWFALATLAAHVALYLLYAHPIFWTVYYLESEPVLALLTALGVARAVAWAAEAGRRRWRDVTIPSTAPRSSVAMLALALATCVPGAMTLRLLREQVNGDRAYFERFDAAVRGIRDERAIVFVRYGPTHNDNMSLVRNPANHDEARVWIAHDRGADNARLIAAAKNRRAYLFDEGSWTLRPLESQSTAETDGDP
jgi:hypothetical protein